MDLSNLGVLEKFNFKISDPDLSVTSGQTIGYDSNW